MVLLKDEAQHSFIVSCCHSGNSLPSTIYKSKLLYYHTENLMLRVIQILSILKDEPDWYMMACDAVLGGSDSVCDTVLR